MWATRAWKSFCVCICVCGEEINKTGCVVLRPPNTRQGHVRLNVFRKRFDLKRFSNAFTKHANTLNKNRNERALFVVFPSPFFDQVCVCVLCDNESKTSVKRFFYFYLLKRTRIKLIPTVWYMWNPTVKIGTRSNTFKIWGGNHQIPKTNIGRVNRRSLKAFLLFPDPIICISVSRPVISYKTGYRLCTAPKICFVHIHFFLSIQSLFVNNKKKILIIEVFRDLSKALSKWSVTSKKLRNAGLYGVCPCGRPSSTRETKDNYSNNHFLCDASRSMSHLTFVVPPHLTTCLDTVIPVTFGDYNLLLFIVKS